jgi:hypothetical protein
MDIRFQLPAVVCEIVEMLEKKQSPPIGRCFFRVRSGVAAIAAPVRQSRISTADFRKIFRNCV